MRLKNIFTSRQDIALITEAASISKKILKQLQSAVTTQTSPFEINEYAAKLLIDNSVKSAFATVDSTNGMFGGNLCINVNDETLHTKPFSKIKFKNGDIVSLDFGIIHHGFYTDHCITIGVGEIKKEDELLIQIATECISEGIRYAKLGNTTGDISYALQSVCEKYSVHYITDYTGHGIGKSLWLDPQVPSFGEKGEGISLQEGMLLCIENQITYGDPTLKLDPDGWSLRTKDGSTSAMVEHMVLITTKGPRVLTQ